MKALILCAGFGKRLGPLTQHCPKPLLSLGPCRIVEHILVQIAQCNIKDVYINLHYLPEQFLETLKSGKAYGVRIHYLHEASPRGTAGTTRDILNHLDDDGVLVHYGDIVTSHKLDDLLRAHTQNGSLGTILVHRRQGSNSHAYFGVGSKIERFIERPDHPPDDADQSFAFSGICALRRDGVRQIPAEAYVDLPRDIFPNFAKQGQLAGQVLSGLRFAIDSPARLAAARQAFADTQLRP